MITERPWLVYGELENMQNKPFGQYVSRNEAEGAASAYRRLLGTRVRVKVVWTGVNVT